MADIPIATSGDTVYQQQPKPYTQEEAAKAYRDEQIRLALAGYQAGADEKRSRDEQGLSNAPVVAEAQGPPPSPVMLPEGAPPPPPSDGGVDFGAMAAGDLGYQGALNQALYMDDARKTVRSANKMYEPTRQYTDTSRGVNERRAGLDQQVYESKMAEAQAAADGADLMAETKMDIADREMARAARDQQRNLAVEENLHRYESQIGDAVRKLNETQDVDPSAGWENKSGWQKVRFALTSMFRGLAGRDPLDLVRFEVQKEVDAQKANQAKAIAGVDAAMGAYRTAGLGMRDTMLAASQDERTADAMTRVALYEGVAAKMEATAQSLGIDVASAEYQQRANELQQTIADERMRLSQIEASNPRYFTKVVSGLGPEERRLRRKMADEMVASGGEAFKGAVGAQRDQLKITSENEYAMQRADQKARLAGAPDAAGLSKEDREAVRQYSNNADVAKLEGIVRSIDDILGQEDIVGVGSMSTSWFGAGARDYDAMVRALVESIGRAQSGGAVNKEEEERFYAMITEGVAFGGGEERLRQNLQTVKGIMDARLETPRRGLSPTARRYITRADNPDFAPEYQRGGAAAESEFE